MTDLASRAFIFDMDGTLVDNMHVHTDAWATLLEENEIEIDRHKFLVATAGRTNREILPTVFGEISEDRISELAERKESLYREAYLPIRKPVAGLVEFLTESQRLGIKMAVATAASNPNMEFILDGLDLRRFFGAVTTATDVSVGKPDPAMFLVSADKLGVEPKNCIVFEDAFSGFEAARRAGMRAVGLATVNSSEDIIRTGSVVEVHADYSSMRPAELLEKY